MDESAFQKETEKYKRLSSMARKILGVDENADKDEIKKAYWKLAMKYHPDRFVNGAEKSIENRRRFENIQAAYDFLVKGKEWNPKKDFHDDKDDEKHRRRHDGYETDSKWGYFLWWRDRFF